MLYYATKIIITFSTHPISMVSQFLSYLFSGFGRISEKNESNPKYHINCVIKIFKSFVVLIPFTSEAKPKIYVHSNSFRERLLY